jgi:uncharacterized membrane protein
MHTRHPNGYRQAVSSYVYCCITLAQRSRLTQRRRRAPRLTPCANGVKHYSYAQLSRLAALMAILLALLGAGAARAAEPVAHGVLFFSPSCPHCHTVMDEVLPPLQARYGDQLVIATIDASQPEGGALYQAAVAALGVPSERLGVPALVFGETILVGSEEIPAQLPGMIEVALAAGGNSWPAIPGFTPPAVGAEAPVNQPATSPFQRDPLGNGAAVVMLLVMVVSVFLIAVSLRMPFDRPLSAWRAQAIPLLALAGMAVATYLAYVEVSGAPAVCGPVGDCNTVQQSEYAQLFGVPVGLLGLGGYTAIMLAWAVRQYGTGRAAHWAAIALPAMALVGTLFSIYLTFLEPFVIGATCLWCLTSAALMTALLWLSAPRGQAPPIRRGRARRGVAH